MFNGETSLTFAAWKSRIASVKALLNAGADVEAKNIDGETPLISAAKRYRRHDGEEKRANNMEVMRLLVDAGANLDVTDAMGRTAYICAIHGKASVRPLSWEERAQVEQLLKPKVEEE